MLHAISRLDEVLARACYTSSTGEEIDQSITWGLAESEIARMPYWESISTEASRNKDTRRS
jgi:hypothetical protein